MATVSKAILHDNESLPPLEPGDQLSREEFERRFDAMPGLKRAELIEGVVHMPSPVRWKHHARRHSVLIGWLHFYEANTPGVEVGGSASVRLDLDNEPQPDAVMIVVPERGGQVTISTDDYIEGAPEFVAEVSASIVSIDLNTKCRVYRRNKVLEYLVWRVRDQAVDWFVLCQSQYEQLPLGADGVYRSRAFPGLWLDPAALIRLDSAPVLAVLQQGLASAEHSAFVERLSHSRSNQPHGLKPDAR